MVSGKRIFVMMVWKYEESASARLHIFLKWYITKLNILYRISLCTDQTL